VTPVFIDNRTADGVGGFCRPESNATVESWRPPHLGPQEYLSPFTPAWSHYNRRRAELIRRKVRDGLAPSEAVELAWLQRETLAAVDRAFPRPPVNLRLVAELEERLGEA
jgi:hypothetical protein